MGPVGRTRKKTKANINAYRLQNGLYGPDCHAAGIGSAIARRRPQVEDGFIKANCIICKNDFSIPPKDYRSKELKYNPSKPCVCDRCNYSLHKEAVIVSGLSLEDLDKLDRMDKIIR